MLKVILLICFVVTVQSLTLAARAWMDTQAIEDQLDLKLDLKLLQVEKEGERLRQERKELLLELKELKKDG